MGSKTHLALRLAFVGLLGSGVVSCAPQSAAPTPRPIETQADLILALGDAGAWAARSGAADPGLFGVEGETLTVNGVPVDVYSFADSAERARVASSVAADASTIAGRTVSWQAAPHIWGQGSILVVYQGSDAATILLLDAVLGDPIAQGGGVGSEPYPPAVTAAIGALAERLAIDPATIEVLSFEEAVWPDGCLGLGAPDEMCMMQITPGWLVRLRARGQDYAARTDDSGVSVRFE